MLGWQPHSRMSNDSIYQERRQKGGHVFEEKVNFIIMFLYFPINIQVKFPGVVRNTNPDLKYIVTLQIKLTADILNDIGKAGQERDQQVNQYQEHEQKRSCVVSPQIVLLRLLNWPKHSFVFCGSPFGNIGKYTQMSPRAFLIFQNFYFQLLITEYERDFSLFNFFFGILKHFPKMFQSSNTFFPFYEMVTFNHLHKILF